MARKRSRAQYIVSEGQIKKIINQQLQKNKKCQNQKKKNQMLLQAALAAYAGKNSARAATITGKARSTALCGLVLGMML